MPDPQTIGERLRTIRRERHLTQEQLGVASGHAAATIGKIECARSRPYLGTVADLADALAIDLELLLAEVT